MTGHETKEYKIVVLGGGGVGKSALTIRLVTNNFLEEYDPTIEDSYRKSVVIDEKACLLDILDTAGQEEFSSMQDQWMREGQAFLVVYSITSRNTFEEAIIMREKILRCKEEEEPPIVLVGNKCDLEYARQVTNEEGMQLAEEWGENSTFFETSAKEKINHIECFYAAVRLVREQCEKSKEETTGGGGGGFRCQIL
jgi:small GTP-binding protein